MNPIAISAPGFWKNEPRVEKNDPAKLRPVQYRPVIGGTRQNKTVPQAERKKNAGHDNRVIDHATGMLPEPATNATAVSLCQLWIQLNHRSGWMVPVCGIKNQPLAFEQAKAFVAFAQADIFDCPPFSGQN